MSLNLGIDGLASGLQTTDLINQLMAVEAAPQTLLKSKQSTAQNLGTALQGINARLLSLAESAKSAATADKWNSYDATSSSSSVTATTSSASRAGSITFSVDAVATRQVSLSAAVVDGPALTATNPPTLTVKKADGTLVTFTAASNSLSDMADAINDSDAGISATAVRVTGGATPTYRLQFTAGSTGTDGAFEVYVGDQAAVNGATAPRLDTGVVTTATNSQLTLWKGTSYEQQFTQSSNTYTGLMTGVDVTVSKQTEPGESVTVAVAPSASKVNSLASGFVGALTTVLQDIDSRTATTIKVKSDGTTGVTGGILTGDGSISQLRNQLVEAATYPVNGISPSTVGIVIGKDGSVTFDAAKFATAVQEDPDGTAAFIQTLAQRVKDVADNASDPYDGTLTQRITSNAATVKDFTTQIENWDRRLEVRRSGLQAQYAALEVAMSNLNAQSSWLSSQLASLSSTS